MAQTRVVGGWLFSFYGIIGLGVSRHCLEAARGHSCPMPLGIGMLLEGPKLVFTRYCRPIAPFPLTPALSLGERGPRTPSAEFGADGWFVDVRPTLLPLPRGEGWGEGERGHGTLAANQNASATLQTGTQILVALDIPVRSNALTLARSEMPVALDHSTLLRTGISARRLGAVSAHLRFFQGAEKLEGMSRCQRLRNSFTLDGTLVHPLAILRDRDRERTHSRPPDRSR